MVYVAPLGTSNEYLPLASVVAESVAPFVTWIVTPWSAPPGPVAVPESLFVVTTASELTLVDSVLDAALVQAAPANNNSHTGTSRDARRTRDLPKPV
jgi:hypothetical protein